MPSLKRTADVLDNTHEIDGKRKKRVLIAALEAELRIGGIGSVVDGLGSALLDYNIDTAVVTPYFDAYDDYFKAHNLDPIRLTTKKPLKFIYKGVEHEADVFRVRVEGKPDRYFIKPVVNSPVAWLFKIKNNPDNIYQAFKWSEPNNRLEYFHSALAAMLRLPIDEIPEFDLLHCHAQVAGAAIPVREFEHNEKNKPIIREFKKPLKKIPHVLATLHMLLARESGRLTTPESIAAYLESLGLPSNFLSTFDQWRKYINSEDLSRLILEYLYCDYVNTVSEGLAHEVVNIPGGGQGHDDFFQWLHKQKRFSGIHNGINFEKFNATNKDNLGELAFNLDTVTADKRRAKEYLADEFPQLDPNKQNFTFISRFAEEKGMDMLHTALEAITKANGNLIIMGNYADPKYKGLIAELKKYPNVLVIDTPEAQARWGKIVRAATDTTLVLSHNEACGLTPSEGYANGAFAVGSNVQGVPGSIKNLDVDPINGTGFLYSDDPATRHENLKTAIAKAATFYNAQHAAGTMNAFSRNLILNVKKENDWSGKPAQLYAELYKHILERQLLPRARIRNVVEPILHLFKHKKAKLAPAVVPTPPTGKIFYIGFNKCGSQSLYYWLIDKRHKKPISAVHYGDSKGSVAACVFENDKNDRPLLDGRFSEKTAYIDIEDIYAEARPLYAALELYKKLAQQYPHSKFIYNDRDMMDWLRSRLEHEDPMNGKSYIQVVCEKTNKSRDEVIRDWVDQWITHRKDVENYFESIGRKQDLLIFHIEKDDPAILSEFLKDYGDLDPTLFGHANNTAAKKSRDPIFTQQMPRPILAC